MKTLQILPSLDVGGVERGVLDLAKAAKARGEETVVVSSGGALVTELNKLGVKHYEMPVHKKSLFSLGLVEKLAELIRYEHIDVVHARSRVPAWLVFFACRRTHVPLVTTCHGYYSNHFLSRVMGWGKKVIVISRVVGRHMIDDFGVEPDHLRLVHRGIDLKSFQYVPHKYDQEKKVLKIINVGRLSPIKGQVEFLKAIHILRREVPNIEVSIVGSEGKGKTKYTEKIQTTIQQLGLTSCVKMLGTRRDIPELLAESDLLVLGTLVPEAFGRVIVEAGAVGTAVVVTRVGGVLDIIDHDQNGLLVPPGDVKAMAEAMQRLLLNREECKKLAAALKDKVEQKFSLEKMVDETFKVYREVAAEKKILILKLGAMGDVILITPSIRMIRARFPHAKISILVDKKHASLLSGCPELDEIIPIDRKRLSKLPFALKFAKKLRREGYDVTVDFQNSKWTHLLGYLSGATERYGFKRGPLSWLLNRPTSVATVAEGPVKNQFRILRSLGVKKLDDRLELKPAESLRDEARVMLGHALLEKNAAYIGFALGSSPQWRTKRWPVEKFIELGKRVLGQYNCKIVLLGAPDEVDLAQEFEKAFAGEQVINLVGRTNASQLVGVVSYLSVLVSGDTAPLHVAASLDVPIAALFGPTDPKRHMPPAQKSRLFVHHVACHPCYKGSCPNKTDIHICMKKISVNEVYEAVSYFMRTRELSAESV